MITDRKPGTERSTSRRRALRGGAALVTVALLLGSLLLMVDFEEERPDFYQPARTPLTEAAMILAENYAEEKKLEQRLRMVHTRLDHSIALLGRAERLDPADKQQIETLQRRLRALEDTDRMRSTDPTDLKRAYQDLTEQLNALARRLAEHKS